MSAVAFSPSKRWGAYQMRRGRSPARFIASAALPACNRPLVGHEVGAADHRDGSRAVAIADQHSVVAAGHRPVGFGRVGVARPEADGSCSVGLPQSAIRARCRRRCWRPRSRKPGISCFAGPCLRFHQQKITGGFREPVQQRVVGQVLTLRHQYQRVGALRPVRRRRCYRPRPPRRRRHAAVSPARGRRRDRSRPDPSRRRAAARSGRRRCRR